MNISKPIGREIDSVHFSLYPSDDIRKISVKAITNPNTYDGMGHPNRGGLYDPALGPVEKDGM